MKISMNQADGTQIKRLFINQEVIEFIKAFDKWYQIRRLEATLLKVKKTVNTSTPIT